MVRFLVGVWLLFAIGCGSDDDGDDDTFCCTVSRFCGSCTTCNSSEITIGGNGDEEACRLVVDRWLDDGRFCHSVSLGERGDQATDRYLAMCSE